MARLQSYVETARAIHGCLADVGDQKEGRLCWFEFLLFSSGQNRNNQLLNRNRNCIDSSILELEPKLYRFGSDSNSSSNFNFDRMRPMV